MILDKYFDSLTTCSVTLLWKSSIYDNINLLDMFMGSYFLFHSLISSWVLWYWFSSLTLWLNGEVLDRLTVVRKVQLSVKHYSRPQTVCDKILSGIGSNSDSNILFIPKLSLTFSRLKTHEMGHFIVSYWSFGGSKLK